MSNLNTSSGALGAVGGAHDPTGLEAADRRARRSGTRAGARVASRIVATLGGLVVLGCCSGRR